MKSAITIIVATMGFYAAAIYTTIPTEPAASPPRVERPDPDRIVVYDTDYATITPWSGIYTFENGDRRFGWNHVYQEGTTQYIVNPETDFMITMYGPDDPDTPGIDREIITVSVPVTAENRLDWVLFNRIKWEREYNEMMAAGEITFFDLYAATVRIQPRLESLAPP